MPRLAPFLLVAVVLVIAGCAAPAGDADPDSIAASVDEQLSSVETFTGTLTWTMSTGNVSDSFTADIAYNDSRVALTYHQPTIYNGTRIVNNGSTVVATNPSTGQYAVLDDRPEPTLSRVFLNVGNVSDPRFEGNETIGGKDAFKLSYAVQQSEVSLFLSGGTQTNRLSEGTEDDVNVTLWVDRERSIPVKARLNYTGFNTPVVMTLEYDDVRIGDSVPASHFQSEFGPDASEVDSLWQTLLPENGTGYATYEAAQGDAGDALPPEVLPENFTFDSGFSIDYGEEARYRLFYTNGTTNREVHYVTEPVPLLKPDDTLTVDGLSVNASVAQSVTFLEWDCTNGTYVVLGPQSRERLVPSVEAIGCS